MRLLVWLVALAACGDERGLGPDGGDDADGDPLVAAISVRTVTTLDVDARAYAIAALDDRRLAVARLDRTGDAFCPDCLDLDPSECPALCERTSVSVTVLDVDTGALDVARPVAIEFPASFDHDVGEVDVVALDADRVGIGWLVCDNATCGGTFARRSCTARYATVDLGSGEVGAAQTLYADRFGHLHLAFEPDTRALLAVTGSDLAVSAGLYRAVLDETGATVRSPWTALGSPAARSPALLAHGGELVVVADDWSPGRAPRDAPCAASCDCLEPGAIEADAGGLFAFTIDAAGAVDDQVERIAAGLGDDGSYGRREQLAVIPAGGAPLIASTQSIDRAAELFTRDGGGWSPRLRVAAPIPLWIGALGTADRRAWIGAQPEPGEAATVQRLVAGAADATRQERATFSEPARRAVFATAPVVTPRGVTTTYLLQGIFPDDGGARWARFEVLAVDADW